MKIGVCVRTVGERGGIGVYTRNLLDAMLPMAGAHRFVLFHNDPTQLGRFADHPNVREIHVRAPGIGTWDQIAVPLAARREQVDVLFHTKFSVPLLAHCPTVMVLHGSERFVFPQFSTAADMLFFRTIYPHYLRRATAIVAVSENARRDVVRFLRIDPSKVHTVHLAASGVFRRLDDADELARVRERYGLPERFLLNVGLMYPGKNIPGMLRALRRVRQEHDVRLVIAGAGRRMYDADLALIREYGLEDAVLLPGYIPHEDLVAVYNLAAAVVFPSFYESFPAIPLEANLCGCPVITSSTGGTPEAAGDAALYVDPTDDAGLADAIRRVLVDPVLRRELIERGYRNARRFSWEMTAARTLTTLERVVGARAVAPLHSAAGARA